jgi:hypothetical protein
MGRLHWVLACGVIALSGCGDSGDDDANVGDASVGSEVQGGNSGGGSAGGRPGPTGEAGSGGRGGRGGTGGGSGGSGNGSGGNAGSGDSGDSGSGSSGPPDDQIVDGWTEFEMQPGATAIYVSNDGNDANPGTEDAPLATLTAGFEHLRDGMPDWLLLRRGDTFTMTGTMMWNKSGPANADSGWMRLGAYGDENAPRPIVDAGSGFGIEITPGFRNSKHITWLAFSDIHFLASVRLANPAAAMPLTAVLNIAVEWQGSGGTPFEHVLFENLRVEGYNLGLQAQLDTSDLRVRRCIFTELFVPQGGSGAAAAMLSSAQGMLIEDNVFYRIQHEGMPAVGPATLQEHAAYITADARDVVARGNVIIHATEGLMIRAGGVYTRNVAAHTIIAVQFGQANGVTPTPGGVPADVSENLLLDSEMGANLGNIQSGQVIGNMLVRDNDGTANPGMQLYGYNQQNDGFNIGVHDTEFRDNYLSSQFNYTTNMGDAQSFSGLTFTNNTENAGPLATSIAGYLSENGIDGNRIEDLGAALLTRDRNNFPEHLTTKAVINYYRQAAGLDPIE